ncbi:hypothetical protein NIES4101_78440 [Calothrix sp. NIES-4101]|nr:hypothetical protein NIES4101_78440 [Calothrix sp. NIES-4101]
MFPVLQLGDRRLVPEEMMQMLVEYQMLPQLVKELVIDDAIAQIKCNQEEEQLAIAQIAQQYQLDSEVKRQMWLQQNNLTSEQLDAIAIRQLKLEKFKQSNWGEDLEAYFRQRKPQLDRVIYSLLRTNDMALAQELYFRISEGEQSFARLVEEYSQGIEVETDGLIGPVELQSLHPVMVKVLSSVQPQQLVPPTQVGDWVVLIRLEKLLPAKLDNSIRQRLLNERFQVWLQTQMQEQQWQVITPKIEVLQPLSISYS